MVERFLAIGGKDVLVSLVRQDLGQRLPDLGIVLYDQDALVY